jgi:hypothetical protein
MQREPPDADPHVRWCGRRRGEPGAYPIDPEKAAVWSCCLFVTYAGPLRLDSPMWIEHPEPRIACDKCRSTSDYATEADAERAGWLACPGCAAQAQGQRSE